MTDEVPAAYLGRVMGVRSILGFGAGALAPMTVGATPDWTHRWAWAYLPLAAGGVVATLAAVRLQKLTGAPTRAHSSMKPHSGRA